MYTYKTIPGDITSPFIFTSDLYEPNVICKQHRKIEPS